MKEALSSTSSVIEQKVASTNTEQQPYGIFISGLGGTVKGLYAKKGIHNGYARVYGKDNFKTFEGAISTDKPDPQYVEKIADTIMTRAVQQPVHVIMHSLGTTAFMYVKKHIQKENKVFFDDPAVKKNLQFLKIGESGSSRSPVARMKYIWHVLGLEKQRDIKTLYTFPGEDIKPSDVTTVFSAKSNKSSEYMTIPFAHSRTNDEFLTEQERAAKEANDVAFLKAFVNNDYAQSREVIKERGAVLSDPLNAVFEGSPKRRIAKGRFKLGGFKGVRLLLRAVGNKPMKELRKLYRMGYHVSSLVPEFDTIVTLNRSSKFYKDKIEAKQKLRIMESSSHDGVALQVDEWAKASKKMFDLAT